MFTILTLTWASDVDVNISVSIVNQALEPVFRISFSSISSKPGTVQLRLLRIHCKLVSVQQQREMVSEMLSDNNSNSKALKVFHSKTDKLVTKYFLFTINFLNLNFSQLSNLSDKLLSAQRGYSKSAIALLDYTYFIYQYILIAENNCRKLPYNQLFLRS